MLREEWAWKAVGARAFVFAFARQLASLSFVSQYFASPTTDVERGVAFANLNASYFGGDATVAKLTTLSPTSLLLAKSLDWLVRQTQTHTQFLPTSLRRLTSAQNVQSFVLFVLCLAIDLAIAQLLSTLQASVYVFADAVKTHCAASDAPGSGTASRAKKGKESIVARKEETERNAGAESEVHHRSGVKASPVNETNATRNGSDTKGGQEEKVAGDIKAETYSTVGRAPASLSAVNIAVLYLIHPATILHNGLRPSLTSLPYLLTLLAVNQAFDFQHVHDAHDSHNSHDSHDLADFRGRRAGLIGRQVKLVLFSALALSLNFSTSFLGLLWPLSSLLLATRHPSITTGVCLPSRLFGQIGARALSSIVCACVGAACVSLFSAYALNDFRSASLAHAALFVRQSFTNTFYRIKSGSDASATWYVSLVMFAHVQKAYFAFFDFALLVQSFPLTLRAMNGPHTLVLAMLGLALILDRSVSFPALALSQTLLFTQPARKKLLVVVTPIFVTAQCLGMVLAPGTFMAWVSRGASNANVLVIATIVPVITLAINWLLHIFAIAPPEAIASSAPEASKTAAIVSDKAMASDREGLLSNTD